MIREQDTDGAPLGSYEVEYWRYGEYGPNGEGGFRRDRASDLYATLAYVERLTAEPAEVIRAICRSQRGGVTIYGSEGVRRAWLAQLERDRP